MLKGEWGSKYRGYCKGIYVDYLGIIERIYSPLPLKHQYVVGRLRFDQSFRLTEVSEDWSDPSNVDAQF